MKSTFRVLFFLKRDKVKKNGNMPIMDQRKNLRDSYITHKF